MTADAHQNAGPRRSLGLTASVAIVVNATLGTGVFLEMPRVLCHAGSPLRALAVWIVAGLVALAGSLIYAELAAMMPQAGGEYVFLRRAFGPLWGFLYGWMRYLIGNAGGQAALVLAFSIFLNALTGDAFAAVYFRLAVFGYQVSFGAQQLVGLAVLAAATAVNALPAAANGRLSAALAVVKVALALAVGAGALLLAPGDWSHLTAPAGELGCDEGRSGARGGVAGLGAALLAALWAYNGWYALALLAGEVRRPGRTLPSALGLGAASLLVLYTLLSVGYLYALDPAEIGSAGDWPVAAAVAGEFLGPTGLALVLAGLLASTFGALQVALMGNARVGYAMARDGLFFAKCGELSARTGVPVNSLLAQAQWTTVLVLSSSMETFTGSMIFASWVFYGLTAVALLVLRRSEPRAPRPYRVWGYPVVPGLFVGVAGFVVLTTLVTSTGRSLAGLGVVVLGVPAYWYWARRSGGRGRGGRGQEP
jgi:APA family basic amino acid/polyamine antiporter